MSEKGKSKEVLAIADSYQGFDPVAYLQNNYTPPRADFTRKDSTSPWMLGCLHRAFTEGDVSGDLLVDVGSGPTLYQVMSGCEVFNRVILTDFLEVNRRELKRWLQDDRDGGMDWTPFLQHVCKLEGRQPSACTEKAARLRAVVSDVLPIDVHSPQPLAPGALPSEGADCVVSCFCLDSVSPDQPTFTRGLSHIRGLLRPGGHLLLIGPLGASYYFAGSKVKIPILPLNEAQVCAVLKETGFSLIRLEIHSLPQDMKKETDDSTGVFFVKARKE